MHADDDTQQGTGRREAARIVLAGHASPRPTGAEWRARLGRVLSPLLRLHRYRDISSQMWHRAINDLDCRDVTHLAEGGLR